MRAIGAAWNALSDSQKKAKTQAAYAKLVPAKSKIDKSLLK